jgi:hypothetical protein
MRPPRRQVAVPAGTTLSDAFLVRNRTYILPAGEFNLTDTVYVNGIGLCIKGAGKDAATGTVVRFAPTSVSIGFYALGSPAALGLFNLSVARAPSTQSTAGAVLIYAGTTLRAEGVAFRGVGMGDGGGALYAVNSNVSLVDVDFVDCRVDDGSTTYSAGGAMTLVQGASVDAYGRTTFVRTYANRGGAIAFIAPANLAYLGGVPSIRFHGPAFFTNVTVSDPAGCAGRATGGRATGSHVS